MPRADLQWRSRCCRRREQAQPHPSWRCRAAAPGNRDRRRAGVMAKVAHSNISKIVKCRDLERLASKTWHVQKPLRGIELGKYVLSKGLRRLQWPVQPVATRQRGQDLESNLQASSMPMPMLLPPEAKTGHDIGRASMRQCPGVHSHGVTVLFVQICSSL